VKKEVKRQTRYTALIGVLAGVAALAALGAVVVGLIALYTWLAIKHGPFIAHGMIGGSLLLIALILFALVLAGRRPRLASRPPLQIARPVALLETLGRDTCRTIVAGSEQALRPASIPREASHSIVLGMLVLAALAGLVAGRRL
jgi:hypothetical protein